MPITVRHENGKASALNAAIALWLAEEQQKAQEQQAAGLSISPDEIRQVLAPATSRNRLTARESSPSPDGPSYRVDNGPVSYGSRAGRIAGGGSAPYSSLYNTLLRGQVQGELADQRYENQDALAQDRFTQQAQLQSDRLAHQTQEQALRDADAMSRQQADDLPQWIGQGLANNSLRYSPAQLRERQELFDSIDKINADDRFTPEQRATFIARQRERIRGIDMSPQEVPPNERPISPQQQAEQITWEEIDPKSGLKIKKYLGSRNGTPQPELDPISDAHLKDWADERAFQRQMKLHEMQLKTKGENTTWSRRNQLVSRKDRLSKEMHEAYQKLREAQSLAERVYRGEQIDNTGKVVDSVTGKSAITSQEANENFNTAATYYERVRQELDGIDQQIAGLESQPTEGEVTPWADMGMGEMGAPPTDIPPSAPMNSGPPMINGRVVVNSEAEAQALNLPPGTPIINSQGRTGVWNP